MDHSKTSQSHSKTFAKAEQKAASVLALIIVSNRGEWATVCWVIAPSAPRAMPLKQRERVSLFWVSQLQGCASANATKGGRADTMAFYNCWVRYRAFAGSLSELVRYALRELYLCRWVNEQSDGTNQGRAENGFMRRPTMFLANRRKELYAFLSG